MKKEIEWTAGDGSKAKVSIELITRKTIDADGDKVEVDSCEIEIEATINGLYAGSTISTFGIPENYKKMGVVAYIGKLGLVKDRYSEIEKAITEIKSTPEWIAKENRIAKNKKERAEYDAHIAMMNKVMCE